MLASQLPHALSKAAARMRLAGFLPHMTARASRLFALTLVAYWGGRFVNCPDRHGVPMLN